jgi:hypothetical protein
VVYLTIALLVTGSDTYSVQTPRLEAAGSTGLTPLVGREQEVALLRERWAQVKDGMGQVAAPAFRQYFERP